MFLGLLTSIKNNKNSDYPDHAIYQKFSSYIPCFKVSFAKKWIHTERI